MRSGHFDKAPKKQFRRFRRDDEKADPRNFQAFAAVLRVYITAIEHSHPHGSSLSLLDITVRPVKWTPDLAHTLIDCENAVGAALGNDPLLLEKFGQWFIAPELLPGVDVPILTRESTKLHSSIIQRCGREFLRRGLYPIGRWFGLPQKSVTMMDSADEAEVA